MEDRYFLDIRVGCGAVRDRQNQNYDPTYPGLHSDTPDVVLYKHGIQISSHSGGWEMREEDIKELQDLCDKLNVWPNRDKIIKQLDI